MKQITSTRSSSNGSYSVQTKVDYSSDGYAVRRPMSTYKTIYLSISKDEAVSIISEKVPDVGRRRVGNTVKYQAGGGLHLATLSEATVTSGEQGSKLRYRTSVVRPHLVDSWAKAKAIRAAVDEYRTAAVKK